MPLEPIVDLMRRAREGGYGVGYFESWSLDSLAGVIDAAEESGSPVIIGFNGEWLSRAGRGAEERLDWYAALGRAAAESASVGCGFIFNECSRDDWVRDAIGAGFNLVMPVARAEESVADYTRRVARLTEEAHAHGVAIEAELGILPSGVSGTADDTGGVTDPDAATEFVAATGVDLLAVSAGNVHVLVRGQRELDLDHLAALREAVSASVELVLHGGTGIGETSLRAAVSLGVSKVNFGTGLKQRYLAALKQGLQSDAPDPHRLLGYGGEEDLLLACRRAVRDAVLEKMDLLGSVGKA